MSLPEADAGGFDNSAVEEARAYLTHAYVSAVRRQIDTTVIGSIGTGKPREDHR